MFFTHICRVAAAITLLTSMLPLFYGIQAMFVELPPTSASGLGLGLQLLLGSLALGTLAEISLSLRNKPAS